MSEMEKVREVVAGRINRLPIMELMGAVVSFASNGDSLVEIDGMKEFHFGGAELRSLNGCVISGLMDAAICAVVLGQFPGQRCATRRLEVEFKGPVVGEYAAAYGKVLSINGRIAACEAVLLDSSGVIKAAATGDVHILGEAA